MNLRRLILLVGAVVLVVGVIGLLMPVSVPGPDNGSIGCGNGIAADQSAAQHADNSNPANLPILNQVIPHTDYVQQCQSAVSKPCRDRLALGGASTNMLFLFGVVAVA